ncbi:TNF receptor-associated factor 5-like [Halichondria panicea]|uniref:TNF receptor-associated factor 5-like n=1 Tax=Halichondria panicea TaxID=6063 RepID=UPI00312B6FAF
MNVGLNVPAIQLDHVAGILGDIAVPQQETIMGHNGPSALVVGHPLQHLPLIPGPVQIVAPNVPQQESQEGQQGRSEMLVGRLSQELLQRWLHHYRDRQQPRPRDRYPNNAIVRQLQCWPQQADSCVLKLANVRMLREKARQGIGVCLTSNPFYLKGCRMCIQVYLNGDGIGRGTHLSVFCVPMHGEYGNGLQWPFGQQVTVTLQDQSGNGHHIARPLPTPPQPPIVMNVASGAPQFAPLNVLTDNDYVSDDTLFLLVRLHP